jgi:hypothetical protein
MVSGPDRTNLVIDRGGELMRLDFAAGSLDSGPVTLHFNLIDNGRLETQIAAIQQFRGTVPPRRYTRLAERLIALHAADARVTGASLREIAELLLGPGEWPGDGEHRKSLVRRLIAAGERMVHAGPRHVLVSTQRRSHI